MSFRQKMKELEVGSRQRADRAKLQSQAADSGRSNNPDQDDKLNLKGVFLCLHTKQRGNPQSANGAKTVYCIDFMVTDLASQARELTTLTTAFGEPLVQWDEEKGEMTIFAYPKLSKEEKAALLKERKDQVSVPGLTETEREEVCERFKRQAPRSVTIREGSVLGWLEFYTAPQADLAPFQSVVLKNIRYSVKERTDGDGYYFNSNASDVSVLAPRQAPHVLDYFLQNPSKDSMIFEWAQRQRYNGEQWIGYAPESRVYQVMNYQNPDPYGVHDRGLLSVYCVTDDDPKAHYTQPKEGSGKSVKKILKGSWVQSQKYGGRQQDLTVLFDFKPYHPESWVETQTGISNPEFWGAMVASHCPPMLVVAKPDTKMTNNETTVSLNVESYHIWLLYWLMQCFVRVPESYVKEQLAMHKRLQGQGDDISTLTFQTADGRVNLLNAKATPKDDRNYLANCLNLYEYTGKTSMIFGQGHTFVVMEPTKMPIYMRVGLPSLSEEQAVAWLSGKPVTIPVEGDGSESGMADELPMFDQRTDKLIYCVPKALADKIRPVLNSFDLETDDNGVAVVEGDEAELAAMEVALAQAEQSSPGKRKRQEEQADDEVETRSKKSGKKNKGKGKKNKKTKKAKKEPDE